MEGERRKTEGRKGEETHIYLREVLHRVLYPNTHENGLKKKKDSEEHL